MSRNYSCFAQLTSKLRFELIGKHSSEPPMYLPEGTEQNMDSNSKIVTYDALQDANTENVLLRGTHAGNEYSDI